MSTQLTIELPKETLPADVEALQTELKQLSEIKGAGLYTPRGAAPGDILVWIKAVGEIAPLIVPLVVEVLRRRKIEKAVISLPSGAKIEVDKATAAEIQQLIAVAQAKS
jgi:hypothetical protein